MLGEKRREIHHPVRGERRIAIAREAIAREATRHTREQQVLREQEGAAATPTGAQIWRDYQDHLTARIRFADPDEDDKRRHEEEARVDAEEQELAARRLFNEAYLQRMGRPQAFGLC